MYYVNLFCVIVTGIVNLAPLSNPTTVKVVLNWVCEPNNVLTVVAVKLICVPVTVAEMLVPIVWVAFAFAVAAAVVLINQVLVV